MTDDKRFRPPRLAEWVLRRFLPPGITGESILGDLREEYREQLENGCRVPGALWYWCQVYLIARRYVWPRSRGTSRSEPSPRSSLWDRPAQTARTVVRDMRFAARTLRRHPLLTVVASYIPARRATRVDPMVALKHE